MPEKHEIGFDYFDVMIEVDDEGAVSVGFRFADEVPANITTSFDYDTFREIIDCVGRFGLGMKSPMLVEECDTRDAIEAATT